MKPLVECLEERCVPASLVYTWTGPGAILDAAPTSVGLPSIPRTTAFPLVITDDLSIGDLDVTLNVSHGYTGDLGFILQAPDGSRVRLIGTVETRDPYQVFYLDSSLDPLYDNEWFRGVGAQSDELRSTTLDDEAVLFVHDGEPLLTGNYQPVEFLSAFDGLSTQGTWTLLVTDYYAQETGSLLSWSMTVTPEEQSLGTLQGRVSYDASGNPGHGITVYIDANGNSKRDNGELSTQTDAQGNYRFDGLPSGSDVFPRSAVVALDTPDLSRVLAPTVATPVQTLFHADFSTGSHGFTTPLNESPDDINLWHRTRLLGSDLYYFGVDGQGNISSHYQSNSTGMLVSPVIDLRGVTGPIALHFEHQLDAEISYDTATVGVMVEGREYLLASNEREIGGLFNPTNGFEVASLDLSAFAGKPIQIFFRFIADWKNNDTGWYIRDVKVQTGGQPRQQVSLTPANPSATVDWVLTQPVVDLVGVGFSIDPLKANWNATFTVRASVANLGDEAAAPFSVDVRLATSAEGISGGVLLGTLYVFGLAPHSSYTDTLIVQLPEAGIHLGPGGKVFVGFVIDPTNAVAETNENNNFAQGALFDYDSLLITTQLNEQAANDSRSVAQPIIGPGRIIGSINRNWDLDYYRIDITTGNHLQVDFTRFSGTTLLPRLLLENAVGEVMVQSDATVQSGRASISQYLPAGIYYLRVSGQRTMDRGGYLLDIDLAPSSDPQQGVLVGDRPRDVRLFDVNKDGILDAIVAASGSRQVQVLLGTGDGSFGPARSYELGATIASAQIGDLNGDGLVDLIAVLPFNDAIAVLPGNGNGTFGLPRWTYVGENPQYAVIVDDPGPGPVYLVTANRNSNDVSIMRAGGSGLLEEVKRIPVGYQPLGIFARDFSGDGLLDVIVANSGEDTVTVLFGDRIAPFERLGSVPVATAGDPIATPWSVAVADVDGDGQLDLLTANLYSDTVSLLSSTSAYLVPVQFSVGLTPYAIRVADINNDGLLDIITANGSSDDVSVLLGDPFRRGNFLPQKRFSVGSGFEPQGLDIGDVNGDGRIDIITANWNSNNLSVLLNNGDGTFLTRARLSSSIGLDEISLRDINLDGLADIITLNSGTQDISVLLGNGDGSFQPEQRYPIGLRLPATTVGTDLPRYLPGSLPLSLFIADLNGDQRPDVVVTGGNSQGVTILLGNGDGSFQAPQFFRTGYRPGKVWVADFNGDGRSDLIVSNPFDDSISLLLRTPTGAFGLQAPITVAVSQLPVSLLVADIDRDGHADVITAHADTDRLNIFFGPLVPTARGTFVFSDQITLAIGKIPVDVALLPDRNGDGRTELVAVNKGSNDVSVLVSDPRHSREYLPPRNYAVGSNPSSVVVISGSQDLNGDGIVDLITVNPNSDSISILLGNAAGTFRPQIQVFVGRTPVSVAVTQLNGDNIPDLVVARSGGDVEILLGIGNGTFTSASAEQGLEVRTAPRVADLDGDGIADLIALDRSGQILFRKGITTRDLTFAPPVVINPGRPASDMTLIRATVKQGRVLKTGMLIVSVDRDGSQVAIYTAGSTTPITSIDTLDRNQRVAAADLNGDGLDDLVITHPLDGRVTVVLQRINRSNPAIPVFDRVRTVFTGVTPAEIAFSDIDGDGRVDILINNRSSANLTVLFNDPESQFRRLTRYRTSLTPNGTQQPLQGSLQPRSWEQPVSLVVGSFLGDGKADVLLFNRGTHNLVALEGTPTGLSNPTVRGKIQGSNGVLGDRPGMSVAADFNRDGQLDVAVLMEDQREVWIYLGQRGGSFYSPTQVWVGNTPTGLLAHDVNADGLLDLVVSNGFGDVLVLLGNGMGGFRPFTRVERNTPFVVIDLDGDGQKDVIVASQESDVARAFLRRADTFVPAPDRFSQDTQLLQGPGNVRLADLNRDGLPDLLIANSGGNSVLVFQGKPGGFSTTAQEFQVGTNPVSVLAVDLNQDGYLDLAVADQGSNDVAILFNTGAAITHFATGPRLRTGGTGPIEVRIQDVTGLRGVADGVPDLLIKHSADTGTVVLRGLGNGFFDDLAPTFVTATAPSGSIQQTGLTPNGDIFFFDEVEGRYITVAAPSGPLVTAVTAFGSELLVARIDGSLSLLSLDGRLELALDESILGLPSALEILNTTTPGLFELYATGLGQLQPMVLTLDLRPSLTETTSLAIALQTYFSFDVQLSPDLRYLLEVTESVVNNLLVGPLAQIGRADAEEGGGGEEEEPESEETKEEKEPSKEDNDAERERFKESVEEALRELGLPIPKKDHKEKEEKQNDILDLLFSLLKQPKQSQEMLPDDWAENFRLLPQNDPEANSHKTETTEEPPANGLFPEDIIGFLSQDEASEHVALAKENTQPPAEEHSIWPYLQYGTLGVVGMLGVRWMWAKQTERKRSVGLERDAHR